MTAREVLDGIKARLDRVTRRLESWDGRDPARVRATTVEAEDDFGTFTVRNYHGSYISALDAAAEQFLDTTPKLLAAIEAVDRLHAPVAIYELDDEGHVQDDKHVRDICGTCSDYSVTENLDDGNYDLSGEYGEVGWPCLTVKAIAAALGEEP